VLGRWDFVGRVVGMLETINGVAIIIFILAVNVIIVGMYTLSSTILGIIFMFYSQIWIQTPRWLSRGEEQEPACQRIEFGARQCTRRTDKLMLDTHNLDVAPFSWVYIFDSQIAIL
jgi:hypothetical protein